MFADPATIGIAPDHLVTLADSGLCALDVLYDADGDSVGASTLAARLRRQVGPFTGELTLLAPIWEFAGLLRARLAAARALDVSDIGRAVHVGELGRTPDAAEIVARATAAADALRLAADVGTV